MSGHYDDITERTPLRNDDLQLQDLRNGGEENRILRQVVSSLPLRQQILQIVIFSPKVQLLQSVNQNIKPREREYAVITVPI
jgi:hypothetical protein